MYFASLFAISFQQCVDAYLDLKLDLYGYFEKGVDWSYIFVLIGIFPAFNVIFLNFYPFKKPLANKVVYLALWTIGSTFYELLSLRAGYFYYHHWNIWYSVAMYPVLFIVNVLSLEVFRRLNRPTKKSLRA